MFIYICVCVYKGPPFAQIHQCLVFLQNISITITFAIKSFAIFVTNSQPTANDNLMTSSQPIIMCEVIAGTAAQTDLTTQKHLVQITDAASGEAKSWVTVCEASFKSSVVKHFAFAVSRNEEEKRWRTGNRHCRTVTNTHLNHQLTSFFLIFTLRHHKYRRCYCGIM